MTLDGIISKYLLKTKNTKSVMCMSNSFIGGIFNELPEIHSLQNLENMYETLIKEKNYVGAFWLSKVFDDNLRSDDLFSKLVLSLNVDNLNQILSLADDLGVNLSTKTRLIIRTREIRSVVEKEPHSAFFSRYSFNELKQILSKEDLLDLAKDVSRYYFDTLVYDDINFLNFSNYKKLRTVFEYNQDSDAIVNLEKTIIDRVINKELGRGDKFLNYFVNQYNKFARKTFISKWKFVEETRSVIKKEFEDVAILNLKIIYLSEKLGYFYSSELRRMAKTLLERQIKFQRVSNNFLDVATKYCSKEKLKNFRLKYEVLTFKKFYDENQNNYYCGLVVKS